MICSFFHKTKKKRTLSPQESLVMECYSSKITTGISEIKFERSPSFMLEPTMQMLILSIKVARNSVLHILSIVLADVQMH